MADVISATDPSEEGDDRIVIASSEDPIAQKFPGPMAHLYVLSSQKWC